MDTAQSDLVEWYKLETEFFQDHVRHTKYVEENNSYKMVKEDWSNCGELGEGGFGVVYKQVQGTTGRYRAVKTIDKRRLPPKLDYFRELLIMGILAKRPELFVKFLGWFDEPETIYIAMEYLPEGDLTKHIGSPLQQETVKTISKQILEGLKVMHQKGIAHRDLKPANIFVVSMSPVRVKLGDFGISKRVQPQAITTLNTQVSTQIYAAPEVLGLDSNSETSDYTNSVDIWSLGCVIYELLAGAPLFASGFYQVSRYFFGKWPFPEDTLKGLPTPTDDVGISLLKSMLTIQPEDRPTAAGALGNAWLTGLKSDEDRDDHDSKSAPGDVALEAIPKSQLSSYPTAPKSEIDTMTIQGAVKKTDPQYPTNISPKLLASDPPALDPYRENSAQSTLETSGLGEHTLKREAPASDSPTRIADWRTYPAQQSGVGLDDSETSEDESLQNSVPNALGGGVGPIINPMKNPNTRQNSNAGLNPNASWNPNQNPNAGRNPNQNSSAGWSPNRNPNVSWNPNQNPNVNLNPNQNPNTGSNPNQNPNLAWALKTGGNPNNNIGWNSSAQENRSFGPIDTF